MRACVCVCVCVSVCDAEAVCDALLYGLTSSYMLDIRIIYVYTQPKVAYTYKHFVWLID